MRKSARKVLALLGLFVLPFITFAQDIPEKTKGLDQRINEGFQPITDAWSSIVFYAVNIGGQQVPLVVILLVCGALFFTLYFGFVNIRRFGLAIQVVRGKHDDLEKDAADVKAEIDIPGWRTFTDYFLILKYQGAWKIVHKSYTWRELPKTEEK